MSKPIQIINKSVTKEKHPILYKWAKSDPETLRETIRSMVKKGNRGNWKADGMAINLLEIDLEHEKAL
ncbi:MAG: hypothetical protein N2691_05945 [Patescibacteria group bacterium]|nr:hypothetical protein [Patescibacteria group bacterium]